MNREDIDRALAGDRASVAALVQHLRPVIHAEVARTLLPSAAASHRDVRQDCEDLVQDVFLRLLAHDGARLRTWDPARGRLEPFVRTIARRRVLAVLRTRSRNPYEIVVVESQQLDQYPGNDGHLDSRIDARDLRAEIHQSLDERGRGMYQALIIEERAPADVARELGVTPNAIYAWTARLGRRLRAMIEGRSDSFRAIDHNGNHADDPATE